MVSDSGRSVTAVYNLWSGRETTRSDERSTDCNLSQRPSGDPRKIRELLPQVAREDQTIDRQAKPYVRYYRRVLRLRRTSTRGGKQNSLQGKQKKSDNNHR